LEVFLGLANPLGIVLNRHGYQNGWAFWPVNFDPLWIEQCNGYTAIVEEEDNLPFIKELICTPKE
jgi:hypothetical protein